jgi:MFS family permease
MPSAIATRMRLSRDPALICFAAFLRSSAVGLLGVVLAIHLARAGFSPTAIGLIIGAGLAGGAAATIVVGFCGDAFGRRRTLVALALLTAAGYAAIGNSTDLFALIAIAFFGMLNGMGRDRGAASALEQAVLPETAGPERRTWVLAWYHLVLDVGHAVGALAAAVPAVLARTAQTSVADATQATLWICAGVMGLSALAYLPLTPRTEADVRPDRRSGGPRLVPESRRSVTRLALLFGLDSLGGGFLGSALVAYWFFERYGTSEAQLALLFFAARALNALSHIAAAWLARRFGLVNTMVFTHLPSSLFLMAAPAAPGAALAGGLFLAREALVEMDVPTRQSYVMAIVRPAERTLASGVTNVTRTIAWAVGSALAGTVMQYVALAGPLLIGGSLKIVYDILLYASFRHVRPPEEQADAR